MPIYSAETEKWGEKLAKKTFLKLYLCLMRTEWILIERYPEHIELSLKQMSHAHMIGSGFSELVECFSDLLQTAAV